MWDLIVSVPAHCLSFHQRLLQTDLGHFSQTDLGHRAIIGHTPKVDHFLRLVQ